MDREDRTVYEGGQGEIIEKKSRFIATVKPVKTEEEEKVLGCDSQLFCIYYRRRNTFKALQ